MEDNVIMPNEGDSGRASAFSNTIAAQQAAQADNLNADQAQALINA
jgi:hypothetical protein